MNKATYPVLELLSESDLALHQRGMVVNLTLKLSDPPGKRTIARALDPLEERGYVRRLDEFSNYFEITEAGRDLLRDAGGSE